MTAFLRFVIRTSKKLASYQKGYDILATYKHLHPDQALVGRAIEDTEWHVTELRRQLDEV
jgi:hypothetical protein